MTCRANGAPPSRAGGSPQRSPGREVRDTGTNDSCTHFQVTSLARDRRTRVDPVERCPATMTTIPAPAHGRISEIGSHGDAGITQQRRGDAQPLAHPQREPADPLARHIAQPGHLDQLIDPAPADAVGLGQRQQVIAGRPAGVHRLGPGQDAQLGRRGRGRAVLPAVDPDPARGGSSRPAIIRIVAGLPAPFGPRKPVTMPGRTTKSSPSTASFSPYRLVRFSTSIIAWSLHR